MANPILSGFRKWIGFNVAHDSPLISEDEEKGGGAPPPPSEFFLAAEDGQYLLTESGENIEVENP